MSNLALDLEFAIRINESDAPLTQEQRNYISDVGEHAMALRRELAAARERAKRMEQALRTIAAGNPGTLTDVEMADIARAALAE